MRRRGSRILIVAAIVAVAALVLPTQFTVVDLGEQDEIERQSASHLASAAGAGASAPDRFPAGSRAARPVRPARSS